MKSSKLIIYLFNKHVLKWPRYYDIYQLWKDNNVLIHGPLLEQMQSYVKDMAII